MKCIFIRIIYRKKQGKTKEKNLRIFPPKKKFRFSRNYTHSCLFLTRILTADINGNQQIERAQLRLFVLHG